MPKIYLLLGSNLGDRAELLCRCRQLLEQRVGEIIGYSPEHQSAPVGYDSDNMYLNQVVVCSTDYSPIEILDITQAIEREMGRVQRISRSEPYADRPIDVDLLYYYPATDCLPLGLKIDSQRLILPHPEIQNRQFVLDLLQQVSFD